MPRPPIGARLMPIAGRRDRRFAASASPLALLIGLAAAPRPLVAQDVDTVRVHLASGRAAVELRIPNVGDVVEALAIRFPGQSVDVTEVVREGRALLDATLTREDGALRFAVVSGAPIVVRYEVTGSLERLPLFVAGGRAELTVTGRVEDAFLLRIDGEPDALSRIDTDTSLPRFSRQPDGTLEAPLTSLPSFLRFSAGGAFSFPRIADALALGLIALGVLVAARKLRRTAADAAHAGPAGPSADGRGEGGI